MNPRIRPNLYILLPVTIVAFTILCALGMWQLQRLDWKQGLLARIAERVNQPARSLEEVSSIWAETGDVEYLAMRVSGHFLPGQEQHYYSVVDGAAGWEIFTPFVTKSATLLVNRGFVPARFKLPEDRLKDQPQGDMVITGLVRTTGEQGLFVPDNDVSGNIWYWRDLHGMSISLGISEPDILPFYLDLKSPAPPGGLPKPGITRLDIPNKHLGYAITWFGLAGTLVIIVALFIRGAYRRTL
ncbi:MAG: SURF1 family protein [Fimbriimonadaceae bacterium]|nr:SURF1 family protein [Alphaproteobacteria bacterium]